MKNFFTYDQNNSGGGFAAPAVYVIVEADTLAQANERIAPHVTLCGDSGRYADYDDCGCCPCCGHRWSEPCSDEPDSVERLIQIASGATYMRSTKTALIKADGTLTTSATPEGHQEIKDYLTEGERYGNTIDY